MSTAMYFAILLGPLNIAVGGDSDSIRGLRELGAGLSFVTTDRKKKLQSITFDHKFLDDQELKRLESALAQVSAVSFQASAGTMTGDLLRAVARIRGLEEMILLSTAMENRYLKWLTSAPKLKRLSISFSQDLTELSATVENKVLLELDISYNRIDDKGLVGLSRLAALERLSLSGNRITDAGLDELLKCSTLKCLDLSNTRVTSGGIEKLVHLKALEELELSWTKLADASFQKLCELPRLRKIQVQFTDVTDGVIEVMRRKHPKLDVIVGPQR